MLSLASSKFMKKVTLTAYAKINLTLDILGERGDGYHLVKMLMQTISISDTVTLSLKDHGQIMLVCNSEKIPSDQKNTAFKAAKEFFKQTNLNNPGLDIAIFKQIPVSAGLAGGSADAAAVIVGLNHLLDTKLSSKELCNIGAKVGADVPFCILGGTMTAEGIGTILTPLPDMPSCYIVLAKPPISVSTKEAYTLHDANKIWESKNCDIAVQAVCSNNLQKLGDSLYNRFETVLGLTEVKDIKRIMTSNGAIGSCMSGSGPSVFAIFDNIDKANYCIDALKQFYDDVYLCRPVTTGCIIKE